MKNLILILIAILTSITITSQVRFNYLNWVEADEKEDSTGYIYYTSDPDTVITEENKYKASIVYYFDNEGQTIRYIPVHRTKVKKDEVVYFGKWENKLYKMTYNKIYGDFIVKERALIPRYAITMYFHRDYDYYDQLTEQ